MMDREELSTEQVASIVNGIFREAIVKGASDIHIEPRNHEVSIRMRVDGQFVHYKTFPIEFAQPIVVRMKIVGEMKIDVSNRPQDGKAALSMGEQEVDLRISILPTVFGEKIVIRLLRSAEVPSLADLGMLEHNLQQIEMVLQKTFGLILVAGPTGSGKTTSLFGMLRQFDPEKFNISTLEDPVEYKMKGVNQTQIRNDIGFSFADGLRSLVRQDPDIIMVGEIRDKETAMLAIESALTGHLVFSTIHTNSAAATVQRLLNMGIEKYLVPTSVQMVISQRLVRRVCPHCQESYRPTEELIDLVEKEVGHLIKIDRNAFELVRGVGCEKCRKSGFSGRLSLCEIMPMTPSVASVIMRDRVTAGDIEAQAVVDGMFTLRQDGLIKAVMGMSTLEEVLAVTQ